MLLPTPKLLLLLALPLPALVLFPSQAVLVLAGGYDAALLLVAALTVLVSAGPRDLVIERRLPQHLSLGAMNQVGWEIRNASGMAVRFDVTEDVPESLEREMPQVSATILPRATAELPYGVTPSRRGLYEFGDIYLRWRLQLGLLLRQVRVKARSPVKVYPNVASLASYELAAMRHRTTEAGLAPPSSAAAGACSKACATMSPATIRPTPPGRPPPATAG